ncbi:MAG: outer membrane protein assembly factor, partial [Candidatus Tectomicrobia bacterium]|nr:outer membrane protein assembly factor [Candidatus Tectomicrobia bacterium]
TLGYQYTHRQVIDDSADDYEDRVLRTDTLFEGHESALWAQVVFANVTAFPRSHSVEDGRYLSAVVEWSTDILGSDLNRVRLRGDGAEYISLPWANHHILKLEITAGAGVGDETAQGSFGLGGLGGLLENTGFGLSRNVSLRGYTSNEQVGDYIVKAGIAYRFPVFSVYRGVSTTLPFYLQQGFIEVFYEGGAAWDNDGPNDEKNWLNSMGVEFNMSMTIFRFIDLAPGLGVAYTPDRDPRRFDPDDDVQVYLTIKGSINF